MAMDFDGPLYECLGWAEDLIEDCLDKRGGLFPLLEELRVVFG
jgi:hypothetical protein